ncbi:primary ciliary dyskinesia protein hypothetical protein [Limosa lapponica baueri]|uniref:Uncharacterized protein n=1 Tax=Limosa lapponica baueri TaxID=1758121 RepID=A0A2I0TR77_LIMLA|nr:primary ciliary dyskinesia protein hypothetical protein [Limosa lapponica baueri]
MVWRRGQFSRPRSRPIQKVKEIEYQNLRFPTDLSNPYAVATVLNQEPGKLKIKDLKEVLCQGSEGIKTREMKEAIFQLKVKQNIQEEEANHLKWQVHKGKDPMSVEFKKEIIENRQREEEQYKAPDALGLVPIESVDVKIRHILPFYDLKGIDFSSLPGGQSYDQGSSGRTDENLCASLSSLCHVRNPTPGLVPVLPPLAYSETNIEYHLCPHPKYVFTKECPKGSSIPVTQKKFLHHEVWPFGFIEVICGVMEWRRFLPVVHSTFSNIPTLTSTIPRDPYSLDMLPRDVPSMLCDLPERDRENIIDQDLHNQPDGHFQLKNNELREKVQKHVETMKLKALNKTLILG